MTPVRLGILGATGLLLVAPGAGWGQSPSASLDSLLAKVREATSPYASTDSARLRNFIRLRPVSRIPGLNPFVGEHWFRPSFLRLPAVDLNKPGYLMYYPIGGIERLVGVGYALGQASGAPAPADFVGEHPAWHLHHPCGGLPGVGSLLLGSAEQCRALGGKPGEGQIVMLHVWLTPNPDGPFGSENPALPFLAVGLSPPDSLAFSDPGESTRLRELGLALGETIGARPRYGTMSEFGADSARFRKVAAPLRARLSGLVDSLRVSEQRGDRPAYQRATDQAGEIEERLRRLYLQLASGAVSRKLMEDWFEAVLTPSGHRLGH